MLKKGNDIHSKNVNNIRKPIIIIGACSDLPLSDNLHKLSNPLKALEKRAVSKKKKKKNTITRADIGTNEKAKKKNTNSISN